MGTMTTYARLLATLSILAPARGREEMISLELLASCSFTFCTICTLREFISAETESLGCSNLVSRAGIDLAREEMISLELLASCSFTFCTICTLREFISAETESLGCSNLVSRAGIDLA